MEANIIKQIFFDKHNHWDNFVKKHGERIRDVVQKEISKFRGCGDPKRGFKLFVCEACHDIKRVPYRCKSRFCNTCATGETEEWSRLIGEDIFQTNHRHIVFTIDEGLRDIFLKHRFMLKDFMNEAVRLVKEWFEKKVKVTPGVIAGLHTFGAKLNFNPHVHMLVTMGGMKKNGEWKTYDYIPFEMLRKQWQTVVLKLIRRSLGPEEKRKIQHLLQEAYTKNGEGFYIYAPKQKTKVVEQLKYIGRYMKRQAIAIKRIEEYDGQVVTFRYYDKTEKKEKRETISVEEFISRIIRHIPDEQFKTIRHYGVYSRRIKKLCKKLVSAWQKEVRKWIVKTKRLLKRRSWSQRIKETTGKDPMMCPECKNFYEYKGEVCLSDGQLSVRYATCKIARDCLERMINDLTGIKEKKTQKEKEEKSKKIAKQWTESRQLCLFGM